MDSSSDYVTRATCCSLCGHYHTHGLCDERGRLQAKLRRIILMAHQEGHGALASVILALDSEGSEQ